ncbi:MAG: nucleotidyl transferase AbiEii/AbiGii toxin family protein, partial [Micropruina sp.]|uniref:nucleotidyl transferase AbiEii/AbiGii toxin family protein n=1 Tax=Micropruina sp. TaxID=2737536 RepID=UPI0039E59B6C
MGIDRVLGDPIELLGYAPETTIAEKGVTILERGITSRWRDYVDIVQLARQGIEPRSCSAPHKPWPATAASPSSPSHRRSSARYACGLQVREALPRSRTTRLTTASVNAISSIEEIPATGIARSEMPLTHVVRAGDFVYIAGQIAVRPDGSLVTGDFTA